MIWTLNTGTSVTGAYEWGLEFQLLGAISVNQGQKEVTENTGLCGITHISNIYRLNRLYLGNICFVLPMGLQSPSTPLILPLALLLGYSCLVQWLGVSICICVSQVLAEPLRGQPYLASVSYCFLASSIVSGFDVCRWDGFYYFKTKKL